MTEEETVREPKEIDVCSNLYRYRGSDTTFYMYTVTITPEVERRVLTATFYGILQHNNMLTDHKGIVFDGNGTLISNENFKDMALERTFRDQTQKMTIEFRNSVKLCAGEQNNNEQNEIELVNCLGVIFKDFQRRNFYVDKRKLIAPKSASTPIGLGLDVMQGLQASFNLTHHGLFLNLDQSFTVFYKPQRLIDLVNDFCNDNRRYGSLSNPTPELYHNLHKYVNKLKVKTTHRGEKDRVFVSQGLITESANQKMIAFRERDSSNEEEISVADYFRKTYKELQYPDLPCIKVKFKGNDSFLPIEVLEIIPMQKYSPKLNESMTASMIKLAAKKPHDRFRIIQDKASELQVFENEVLKEFGMAFDNQFVNCKGLMLPPPKIQYNNNNGVEVNNGSWNLRDVQALRPVEIKKWKIFYFKSRDRLRPEQLDNFIIIAEKYGLNLSREHPEQVEIKGVEDFYAAPKEYFNMVVLPDKNSLRYDDIKRVGETYTGNVTQCVLGSNIQKMMSPAFVGNILLKIVAKLGGENHCLEQKIFGDKKTMLIGINCQHPGVSDVDSPTVIAAVASTDYNFVNYKTVIKQQERRNEIVQDMEEVVISLLRAHYAETKSKPERIIVFRDGIAEPMFDPVFKNEVDKIAVACAKMDKTYQPEINYIVAQKRHGVRFAEGGQHNNLVPGTFVSDLNAGDLVDFFLVSAHALQGTARPTRYKLLRNDSGFTREDLYANIYNLCHLYARATKSVSVVPPVYYAELAATRGRAYFERDDKGEVQMRDLINDLSNNLFYI